MKEIDGEWKAGTILADGSVWVIAFAEDNAVRARVTAQSQAMPIQLIAQVTMSGLEWTRARTRIFWLRSEADP